jgi:predicted O-linked N-acetylglucosamine transferase (SPINDLY family)
MLLVKTFAVASERIKSLLKSITMSKELKLKLKALRDEHAGKPISRMTPEELQNEIEHHEVACKTRVLKAARLDNLKKAREARGLEKEEKEDKVEVKVPSIVKAKMEKKKEEIAVKKSQVRKLTE